MPAIEYRRYPVKNVSIKDEKREREIEKQRACRHIAYGRFSLL